MKHIKQHPFLGLFYFCLLIVSTLYLFNPEKALMGGIVLFIFIFLMSYWDKVNRLKQNQVLIDYKSDEITRLKSELTKEKKESDKWHTEWARVRNYNEQINNDKIKLKTQVAKLTEHCTEIATETGRIMTLNHHLEKELAELKEWREAVRPFIKSENFISDDPYKRVFGIDTITDQPDIPEAHFDIVKSTLDGMNKVVAIEHELNKRAVEYLEQKEKEVGQ